MEHTNDEALALRRLARLIRDNRAEAKRLSAARRSLVAALHHASAEYTQERLAEIAQVSQPYINRMIRQHEESGAPLAVVDESAPDDRERLADLGRRLRVARERRGLTVAAVAAAADMTEADLNLVEDGGDVLLSDFLRLVAALGRADWIPQLESLEPTPNERLAAIEAGQPLPMDAGSWGANELRRQR